MLTSRGAWRSLDSAARGGLIAALLLTLAACGQSQPVSTANPGGTASSSCQADFSPAKAAAGENCAPQTGQFCAQGNTPLGVLQKQTIPCDGVTIDQATHSSGGLQGDYLVMHGSGPIDAIYVALHYLNANIGTFANVIRLPELAKARHVLIIVPQAPNTTLSGTVGIEQWPTSNDTSIDATVQYLDSLVSDVRGAYGLGDVPVVVSGLSNGGDMAYEWGCRSSVPDAIQPVAADINPAQITGCTPPHPLGSVLVHGTADVVAPYNGLPGLIAATPDVHQNLKTLAGCTAADTLTTLPNLYDALTVTIGDSGRCPNGTRQDLVTVQNGGHNWPGYAPAQGPVDLKSIGLLGPRTNNFDATIQGYDLLIDSIAH